LKVRANPEKWRGYQQPTSEQGLDDRLTSFQKLVFIKTFEEEKVGTFHGHSCLYVFFFGLYFTY